MNNIQRYDYDKVWGMEKNELGDYVQYDDHAAIVAKLEERNSGLEAARFAYASEFPLNSEGEPDVGSIHQNIRKLKADYAQLEADLAVEKQRADSNERMFHAACEDLGLLSEAFDIDSNIEGGAEPILEAIDDLKEELAEAQKVIKVVDGLVTAKGRYHTAQWYQKMITALDEYKAAVKEQGK